MANNKLIIVGTNHKFSTIRSREVLAFSRRQCTHSLLLLGQNPVLKGAVILSTCNRVELYASTDDPRAGIEALQKLLFGKHSNERGRYFPYLYIYEGQGAISHLFSVACGLDSLILGETQILSQLNAAFIEARNADFTDEFMDTVFDSAITFARNIHRETTISEGKVSIGSAAIDFIKERSGSLWGKNILIIGAGKVTELVLKYLQDEKPKVIFISSRTFEKAKELASRIGQSAVHFDELTQLTGKADIIISATKSPHFILRKENLGNTISRKLMIVDLAIPRDVDPRIGEIQNVELFNLEDLSAVVQKNLEKKRLEAERIKNKIKQRVFLLWQKFTVSEPEPALLP